MLARGGSIAHRARLPYLALHRVQLVPQHLPVARLAEPTEPAPISAPMVSINSSLESVQRAIPTRCPASVSTIGLGVVACVSALVITAATRRSDGLPPSIGARMDGKAVLL